MENLKTLALNGTIIGDKGIAELKELKKLETLNLLDSLVTQAGVVTSVSAPLRDVVNFRQTLDHWTRNLRHPGRADADEGAVMTKDQCESLKSLGYLPFGQSC